MDATRPRATHGEFVRLSSREEVLPMRLSRDWWAVLAAAAAILLIKSGVIAGIPW
jgi:hypothetical protein